MAVCPDIVFSVTNQDSTPIDPSVFTFDAAAQTMATVTTDLTKVALYPMTLAA